MIRKPHDSGPTGSGDGVNLPAMLVLLLVCLLVVAPIAVRAWRKGDRFSAAVIVVAPVAGIGLWVLVLAL